jgi:UDP-N-acetylmuramoylalanine--D-glutamate ligase
MMEVLDKRVLVVGLARSGRAIALCLRRHGAIVTVTDLRPPYAFRDAVPQLLREKIGLELGSQREETFLAQDLIVISPGVPWDLPQLLVARGRQIPVVPEVEAASWFVPGTLIGVTGTNGKTTTTALLGKMLEASGFSTFVGGNIGVPLSLAADHFGEEAMIVTELSSFQLEGIGQFRPHIAVMLNLSPNHLDRHPTFEAYVLAKRQIFRNQRVEDVAVLNADDAAVESLGSAVAARRVFFSRRHPLPEGVFVAGSRVVYRVHHLERFLFETHDVRLLGGFNLEDVLAASTAACVVGADFDAIRSAVQDFCGVEHRLEFVREIEGVQFYNNSKATSVDATVNSLTAFGHGVHLILGGKDKGAPYAPLRPLIKSRVRELLLIGAAAQRIASGLAGSAEIVQAGTLEPAVREAFRRALPGDVVLLAPACSSFDQFQDFEDRGRVFKEIVLQIAREVEKGEGGWREQRVVHRRAVEAVTSVPKGQVCPLAPPQPAEPARVVEQPRAQPEVPGAEMVVAEEPAPAVPGRASFEPPPELEVTAEGVEPAAEAPSEEPGAQFKPLSAAKVAALTEPSLPTPGAIEKSEKANVTPEEKPKSAARDPEPVRAVDRRDAAARRRIELEYVYEVAAEELPPPECEPVQPFEEEIQIAPLESGEIQAPVDEVLPFEVRSAADSKRPADSTETPIAGQRRLPGLE